MTSPTPPWPMPAMQVESLEEWTRSGAPVTWLGCSGALVGPEAIRLLDHLLAHTRHGPRHLLLDLEHVRGVDDAGATALLEAHRHAGTAGCTLTLVAISQAVYDRLTITGLQSVLRLEPTLEASLTALDRSDWA